MDFIKIVLIILSINQISANLCPHQCDCTEEPTSCPVGESLIKDGCNCCMVCARQEGQSCDLSEKICDPAHSLYCDFAASHDGNFGICKVRMGKSCLVNGRMIPSGEVWEISCKEKCWCFEGYSGCMPTCPVEAWIPDPTECPNAFMVEVPGECCPRWECGEPIHDLTQEVTYSHSNEILDNIIYDEDIGDVGDELLDYQLTPFEQEQDENNLYGLHLLDEVDSLENNILPGDIHEIQSYNNAQLCQSKATAWTPCSKTCGLGISTRMSNSNFDCKIERQTRLCNLRPCSDLQNVIIPQKRQCLKQRKQSKREVITYIGCSSIRKFRPRYCGLCHHDTNKCCTPKLTRTTSVDFYCPDGRTFRKKLLVIRSCQCTKHCVNRNKSLRRRKYGKAFNARNSNNLHRFS